MGTLYIDRKDFHIRLDGNALSFYVNGKREGAAPIAPIKRVIIIGKLTVETDVLHRLVQEGIPVLFLSGKRNSFRGYLHGKLHNNGLLRVKQYERAVAADFPKAFSLGLVKRKLISQYLLLEEASTERPDVRFVLTNAVNILKKMEEALNPSCEKDIDTLRGVEGGAAATYFSAFANLFPDSLNFTKRQRRPPSDPVNAMLSLCYTMLHYEAVREIEVIGLDPTIGFYHQFEYGRESLACDLIEPYRAEVDRLVWGIFRKRVFTSRDFAMDDERPGCYLKKNSRKMFYEMYEEWASNIRSHLVEDVRTLSGRIMDEAVSISN